MKMKKKRMLEIESPATLLNAMFCGIRVFCANMESKNTWVLHFPATEFEIYVLYLSPVCQIFINDLVWLRLSWKKFTG